VLKPLLGGKPFLLFPYVVGVATAPLLKPLARAALKSAIGVGLEAKRLAAEAAHEVQALAAEASTEKARSEDPGTTKPPAKKQGAASSGSA